MVPATGDDQRPFRPALLPEGPVLVFDVEHLRLDDRETPDGAFVTAKDMRAPTLFEVPYPHRTVGRTRDEGVLGGREGPHAAAVTFERLDELAGKRVVDVDGVVVGSGDDAVVREEETRDDRRAVSGERNPLGMWVRGPLGAGQLTRFEEDLVRMRKGERRRYACGRTTVHQRPSERPLGPAAEPASRRLEELSPEDWVAIDDGSPGFGNTCATGKGFPRKEGKDD